MHIRGAKNSDIPAIIILFRQAVLHATVGDYNKQQRYAWAARGSDPARWQKRIATQHFLVAKQADGLVGFGSIASDGYLDVLYVHHAHQGRGVATRLLTALEDWASQQKLFEIATDASITARPFFARHGYEVLKEQQNRIEEEVLINYRMQKTL